MSDLLQILGMIAATAAVAGSILSANPLHRRIGLVVGLGLALALIAGQTWGSELRDFRDSPGLLAAGLVGGAILIAALAAVFWRWPIVLPLALLAAMPFRIPIHAAGDSFNLLVPLYVVLAAALVAVLLKRSDGEGDPELVPPPLRIVLAAALILYGLQTAYSNDLSRAVQEVGFFLVPFAAMFVILTLSRWDRRLLAAAIGVVIAEALIFAAIGVVQHETRHIFWNAAVEKSNEFQFYFRTNSLFWDPNIYGRYLALAIVISTAALLWSESGRRLAGITAAIALLLAGLAFSFSMTSFAATLAGLAVLAALRWSLRWTLVGLLGAFVAGLIFLAAFGSTIEFCTSADCIKRQTSGRNDLVSGGIEQFGERPVWGHGSGSFGQTYIAEHPDLPKNYATISHTEPVTVAAEQGLLGLGVYLALLAVALATLFGALRAIAPGLSAGWRFASFPVADGGAAAIGAVAIAAAFVAMLVHTIGYAAFLSDPLTWALLAIGGRLSLARRRPEG